MRVNRFVLDNNIWVSYFITKQQQKIVDLIDKFEIEVFSCEELIDEFTEVLGYPHLKKFNVDIAKSVKLLLTITTYFTLTKPIKQYIPGDADDNYILALALQTNSGFVTSGDKHILSQKEVLEKKFTKLKIITKTQFERRFTSS
ncbi:MAG: putative toxin-antitoxin system toxin component, PIN family [Flavobacterium sp.]|nr:putative toxin-antitoxin system toxin component, PIN family [Flavobacterium sp.]